MSPWQWIGARIRTVFASPGPFTSDTRLQALNRTRGMLLATRIEVAASGRSRRKGLLGRAELASGEGLWIVPCESVHTFFMRFPIDLVYLDRKNKIRKLRSEVGPWRISACLSAHSVLELQAGTIRTTRAERGDIVEFGPCAATGQDYFESIPGVGAE
jgi:uncharacterized membrane protein (UPF0127 family)